MIASKNLLDKAACEISRWRKPFLLTWKSFFKLPYRIQNTIIISFQNSAKILHHSFVWANFLTKLSIPLETYELNILVLNHVMESITTKYKQYFYIFSKQQGEIVFCCITTGSARFNICPLENIFCREVLRPEGENRRLQIRDCKAVTKSSYWKPQILNHLLQYSTKLFCYFIKIVS